MSAVRVRDATALDAPVLVGFIVAEGRESEGRALDPGAVGAAVGAALHDPALLRYWLAVDGDTVLGAIAVSREWSDWNNAAYWWIGFVFVVPTARGSG